MKNKFPKDRLVRTRACWVKKHNAKGLEGEPEHPGNEIPDLLLGAD